MADLLQVLDGSGRGRGGSIFVAGGEAGLQAGELGGGEDVDILLGFAEVGAQTVDGLADAGRLPAGGISSYSVVRERMKMSETHAVPDPDGRSDEERIEEVPAPKDFERDADLPRRKLALANLPVEFAVPEWNQLSEMYTQRRHEAKVVFRVAIPLAIAGAVVILTGVMGGVANGLATGSVLKGLATSGPTGAYGAVMDFLGFFMIRFYKQVNSGIDSAVQEIHTTGRERRLFWMADQIADPKARDAAIANLVKDLSKHK